MSTKCPFFTWATFHESPKVSHGFPFPHYLEITPSSPLWSLHYRLEQGTEKAGGDLFVGSELYKMFVVSFKYLKKEQTSHNLKGTPPETNIKPENHAFKKENHLPNLHFQVPWCSMLVFGGVHTLKKQVFEERFRQIPIIWGCMLQNNSPQSLPHLIDPFIFGGRYGSFSFLAWFFLLEQLLNIPLET